MAFTANAQLCPDNNHPHMIDLGLPSGTKWACCNVGADKPEEKGGYYAWGETEEKDYYDWSTYIHCDGSYDTCHNLGSDIAGTQYDVAHVLWGGSWVMPTEEQFKELFEYCDNCEDFMPTELGSVKGIKITSRKNGKSIFLRGAGFRRDNEFQGGTMSQYWTSTPKSDNTTITCWVRNVEHLVKSFAGFFRFIGASVRPVCKLNMKDNKAGGNG